MAMPKWTRYNASTNANTPVSNTYRLDVYGVKSDLSPGRLPEIHSGWMYSALNVSLYYRTGVFSSVVKDFELRSSATPVANSIFSGVSDTYTTGCLVLYPGIMYKGAGSSGSGQWQKISHLLKEVV